MGSYPPDGVEPPCVPKTHFQRFVKEKHMAKLGSLIVARHDEGPKRVVRKEFDQMVISSAGGLMNQHFETDDEVLRRNNGVIFAGHKPLECPVWPLASRKDEGGVRAVNPKVSLRSKAFTI